MTSFQAFGTQIRILKIDFYDVITFVIYYSASESAHNETLIGRENIGLKFIMMLLAEICTCKAMSVLSLMH